MDLCIVIQVWLMAFVDLVSWVVAVMSEIFGGAVHVPEAIW